MNNDGQSQDLQKHYGDLLNQVIQAEKDLTIADFVPAPRHILVQPLPPDTHIGSIELPHKAQLEKSLGVVRAVSPLDPVKLHEVGDLLLYRQAAGQKITIEDSELCIIQYFEDMEGDILGHWPKRVFEKEDASLTKGES